MIEITKDFSLLAEDIIEIDLNEKKIFAEIINAGDGFFNSESIESIALAPYYFNNEQFEKFLSYEDIEFKSKYILVKTSNIIDLKIIGQLPKEVNLRVDSRKTKLNFGTKVPPEGECKMTMVSVLANKETLYIFMIRNYEEAS